MKLLLRITAAIAIFSARADAECDFCPDGISNADFVIPDYDGQTCGSIAESALALEGDICDSIKMAELLCCDDSMAGVAAPEVTNPCSVCPDGLTVDEDFKIDSDIEDSLTCGKLIEYAERFDKDTQTCDELEGNEIICCPTGPAENPCPICTEGITVDESTHIPDNEEGLNCGALVGYALNTEEDDEMCTQFKEAGEYTCCPPSTIPEIVDDGHMYIEGKEGDDGDEGTVIPEEGTAIPLEKEDESIPKEEKVDESSKPDEADDVATKSAGLFVSSFVVVMLTAVVSSVNAIAFM